MVKFIMFAMLITRIGIPIENIFKKYCHEQLGTTSYPMRVISTQLQMANFVMETEIWKDIPGFEGLYQASNTGKIKALKRTVYRKGIRGNCTYHEKILAEVLTQFGYKKTLLCKNAKRTTHFVHRLVAKAFLDDYSEDKLVNHKNRIRTDNRLCNIEMVTYLGNAHHYHLSVGNDSIGVSWKEKNQKWQARKTINGKRHYIGIFKDKNEALKAYEEFNG